MAFGQQTGPPASARQVEEISALLDRAGYASFREARHIFGLSQRQASGRFTQDEAVELIERLQSELADDGGAPDPGPGTRPGARVDRSADRRAEVLATVPAEELADELVRRGWMCVPPV